MAEYQDRYERAHKDIVAWLHALYRNALAAEASHNRTLHHAKQSVENNESGARDDLPGAKQRLAVSRVAQEEATRVKDMWWAVVALLELILHKSLSEERRSRLPLSLQEFLDV